MSANIELVTSHKGTPHITTDQARDLLAGFSGDIDGIKVFSNLDNAFEYTVLDATTINIKTGQALAAGFHFQLLDAYDWILDPGVVGYSRYDSLYLVIYEDPITFVQTADFVYQVGELYQNGTTGTVPDPPTGTNIKEAFEFLRVQSADGAIVVIDAKFSDYLSNKKLETSVSGTVSQVQKNKEALDVLRFGVDSNGNYGYKKVGADSVTPFRNPQGNAARDDVLINKTFSSKTEENVAGTMPDFTGSKRQTVTPAGGTGKVTLSLTPGKCDSVIVDRTAVYNYAQSETWESTFTIANGIPTYMECSNIKKMTIVNDSFMPVAVNFKDKNWNNISIQTIMSTADVEFPNNSKYIFILDSGNGISSISVTYQAKQLRGK